MIKETLSILLLSLLISWVPAVAYVIVKIAICSFSKKGEAKVLDTGKERIAVYVMCFLLSVSYVTMKEYWGNDTIGSFFSRNEFQTQYYVHLFPEGSDSKNYLVTADLHVYDDNIAISKVYWSSGGYTTFDDYGSMDSQDLYLEGHINIPDDEGIYWTIVLTDNKVKNKRESPE